MSVMPSDMAAGAAGAPLPQHLAPPPQRTERGGTPLGPSAERAADSTAGVDETAQPPAILDHPGGGRAGWNYTPEDDDDRQVRSPRAERRLPAPRLDSGQSSHAAHSALDEPGRHIDLHG